MTSKLTTDQPWAPADREISEAQLVFGAADIWEEVLPPMDQLPDDFQYDGAMNGTTTFTKFINDWFMAGVKNVVTSIKPGVPEEAAARALCVVAALMGSFGPSHEHKIGGCAFILASYFDDIKYESGEPDLGLET